LQITNINIFQSHCFFFKLIDIRNILIFSRQQALKQGQFVYAQHLYPEFRVVSWSSLASMHRLIRNDLTEEGNIMISQSSFCLPIMTDIQSWLNTFAIRPYRIEWGLEALGAFTLSKMGNMAVSSREPHPNPRSRLPSYTPRLKH
jgi:hypothetical protein